MKDKDLGSNLSNYKVSWLIKLMRYRKKIVRYTAVNGMGLTYRVRQQQKGEEDWQDDPVDLSLFFPQHLLSESSLSLLAEKGKKLNSRWFSLKKTQRQLYSLRVKINETLKFVNRQFHIWGGESYGTKSDRIIDNRTCAVKSLP